MPQGNGRSNNHAYLCKHIFIIFIENIINIVLAYVCILEKYSIICNHNSKCYRLQEVPQFCISGTRPIGEIWRVSSRGQHETGRFISRNCKRKIRYTLCRGSSCFETKGHMFIKEQALVSLFTVNNLFNALTLTYKLVLVIKT